MRLRNISVIDSYQIQKSFPEIVDSVTYGNKKVLSFSEFLQALAIALATRNIETWEHSVLVTKYAVMLGLRLGLSREEIKIE